MVSITRNEERKSEREREQERAGRVDGRQNIVETECAKKVF